MDYHAVLSTGGGILALVMFIPMLRQVLREKGRGQSFASWFLWGTLDSVLVATLIQQKGNFWIIAGFALGDLIIAGALIFQRRFNWGRFETLILVLVIICAAGWRFSGPQTATVFSILAICVAGVPGFLMLKRHPDRTAARVWLGFALANAISFFGGTAMTLEQRLAPGVFTVASLLMVWAGFRRRADQES